MSFIFYKQIFAYLQIQFSVEGEWGCSCFSKIVEVMKTKYLLQKVRCRPCYIFVLAADHTNLFLPESCSLVLSAFSWFRAAALFASPGLFQSCARSGSLLLEPTETTISSQRAYTHVCCNQGSCPAAADLYPRETSEQKPCLSRLWVLVHKLFEFLETPWQMGFDFNVLPSCFAALPW